MGERERLNLEENADLSLLSLAFPRVFTVYLMHQIVENLPEKVDQFQIFDTLSYNKCVSLGLG